MNSSACPRRFLWSTVISLFTVTTTVTATVFSPCDLAMEISLRTEAGIMLFNDIYIPYIVCMAGYHNYSTTNEMILRNGTVSYGLFGLSDEICGFEPDSFPVGFRDLDSDLECLSKLYRQDRKFIEAHFWLCDPLLTEEIHCHSLPNMKIRDPIYKDILVLTDGSVDRNTVTGAIDYYRSLESFKEINPSTKQEPPANYCELEAIYWVIAQVITPYMNIIIAISIIVLVLVIGVAYYFIVSHRRCRLNRSGKVTNTYDMDPFLFNIFFDYHRRKIPI